MKSNAGCWRRRRAVLVIATSWLNGCAGAGFEANGLAACPPVVEYSREVQTRAAEELALLPNGSAVIEMMGDYAVMRDQARTCQKFRAGEVGQGRTWSPNLARTQSHRLNDQRRDSSAQCGRAVLQSF